MTVDNTKSTAKSEKGQKNSSIIDLPSVTSSNVKLTGGYYEKENGDTGNHLDEAYDPFSNRETSHRTS
ncbi:hypothetical protein V9T40_013644 [Parthenolecanium corni]|uniref:Uncharacterized protein n=1 Tax=Parthenolecanium corni TaxID=536013 RepID=A0AAN9TD14_9HEMI